MGRHKEWRAVAKRERRRRIRVARAKQCDNALSPSSHGYEEWLKEQETIDIMLHEQIERDNEIENRKWEQAEERAIIKWKAYQQKRQRLHQEKLQKEAKIRQELEEEQKKIEAEIERIKQIEEEKKEKQERFIKNLEMFLSGDSTEPPEELLVSHETKPSTEPCPFFSKMACCRFGDQCSRNHRYPGISKVLLAVNFFTHFGLENSSHNEYDTDVMLEYEDSETYKDFKEFFNDVVPEFEKYGSIIQFKVCNNFEKHLRGNMYVEFSQLTSAVAAYRSLHGRWYGGRQLSLQFCEINSWKNAICGLQSGKRCPKGRSCNFLHVFRNPNNMFNTRYLTRDSQHTRRVGRSSVQSSPPSRSWRWSESPERRRERSREKSTRRRRTTNKERRHRS